MGQFHGVEVAQKKDWENMARVSGKRGRDALEKAEGHIREIRGIVDSFAKSCPKEVCDFTFENALL